MSALATGLVLTAAGLAGWDGYRGGRRRALRLGAWMLAGMLVTGGSVAIVAALGLGSLSAVLALTLVAGVVLIHGRAARAASASERGRLGWRLAGAGTSILALLVCCQVIALVTVALIPRPRAIDHATAVPSATSPAPAEPSPWDGVRALGSEIGRVSGSLLGEIPIVGRRSTEITALLRILNAEPEELALMAQHHRLRSLAASPAVLAALEDEALQADIAALAEGDLRALDRITESPRLAALQRDEAVRAVVRELDLQELTAVLDRGDGEDTPIAPQPRTAGASRARP